ncbi:flavodoxin family protein [Metaclostridioides mangenotii]|uniref:Flavodoxin n=1 Tax=Metaclostridioides mangenotii TaxID=1540 RepID=A0ABS4EC93_9FIRM|nr:flavodoxin [Clostridioides mangenotii]MBP1855549.1 flavodoxin [Clostridioides mangenotii]
MKSLVVYYSLGGNTQLIASIISQKIDVDILEIRPEKEIPKKGFMKFFLGGKSVMLNENPKLLNEKIDLDEYDTIFIGTPVWAGSYSSPIASFISKNHLKGKKIALFACHSGGGSDKCFEKLENTLLGNEFVGNSSYNSPLKVGFDDIVMQVHSWIDSVVYLYNTK